MGRGVSSGGGQSSLGYLFGSGEAPNNVQGSNNQGQPENGVHAQNPSAASQPISTNQGQTANGSHAQNASGSSPIDKGIPAGIPGNLKNNYHRADGQNCGNFITVTEDARKLKFSACMNETIVMQSCHGALGAKIDRVVFYSPDRPSTKVHAAPGGGSSLGYLFGDSGK